MFFSYICSMKQDESKLQRHCVQYFRLAFPKYSGVFFSVPNGGYRNTVEAARLKAEGALAGVADLLLLVSSGKYNCLAIEMKTEKGRQSERQKEFQKNLTDLGGLYVVCRSFDDFKQTIDDYLRFVEFQNQQNQ